MLSMVGCRWTASHEEAEVVPLDFLNNARQLHLEGRTYLGAQLGRSFGIEVEVLDTYSKLRNEQNRVIMVAPYFPIK